MEIRPAKNSIAAFGPFELDHASGELRKHGVQVRLAPQQWQVLAMLVERPGEIVSRDEIKQLLWSDDTFVDFEHGLNATMNRLRQALGDSAETPRYIQAVPGRGYRFLAEVQTPRLPAVAPALPAVETKAVPAAPASRRRTAVWLILAGLCVVVAGALVILSNARSAPVSAPSRVVRFAVPAPAGYGLEPAASRQAFAISPDGSKLAFTALGDDGSFRLWLRDLAVVQPREVANAAGLQTVFWSPGGDSLFYSVQRTLRRIRAHGGAHQVIAELPQAPHFGTWLAPDRMLLSNRGSYVTPAWGGAVTRLEQTYLWPQALPDGKHILSISYEEGLNRYRLRVEEFGKPQTSRSLLETDSRVTWVPSTIQGRPGNLLYVRSGTLLAQPFDADRLELIGPPVALARAVHFFPPTGAADFSVSQNGVLVYHARSSDTAIEWRDRQGRAIGGVGPPRISTTKCVRLAPDGTKIAAAVHNNETGATDIWLFDAATRTGRVLVSGPGVLDAPIWSADSKRLLYSRALGSTPKLYLRGLGEQDREEQLPGAPFQLPTDWSRDGRYVLFTDTALPASANEIEGNIGLIDLRTREVKQLLDSRSQETNAVFSPNGKWIAYISNDSGQPEAYLQAFDSGSLKGERIRVSRAGALYVRWRGDGREVIYLGTDGALYAVPVIRPAKPRPGIAAMLFRVPIATRAVLPTTFGFDVAANGSRLLMPVAGTDTPSHLVVVQNWDLALPADK